jgi:Fic family protein
MSATMRRRNARSYRAAVVPTIAARTLQLPPAVAALATEASVEIARFDAELGSEAAQFAPVLLRAESRASSMIENLTSSAEAMALAELGSHDNRNATEIVGNVAGMTVALQLAQRLDADAILAMHRALIGSLHPDMAGRWREEQVWIGGASFSPHEANFVPPHHELVPELIDDLIRFAGRTDLPVLAQAAIAHAQFETIHPFHDGNGRTGRALIHAMLRGHGLTRTVTVPVSAGLLTNTQAYFDSLTMYRRGEPHVIVERLAEASFAATANVRQLVAGLRDLRQRWTDKIKVRRGAAAWHLADLLLRQPAIDAIVVASELGIETGNAGRAIAPLVDAGVLTEFTGFKRNRMWQAREVLTALDDFAARVGRRK